MDHERRITTTRNGIGRAVPRISGGKTRLAGSRCLQIVTHTLLYRGLSCGGFVVANRYTHVQFLDDTQLFELPEDGSFTQVHVKRRRHRLMQKHHPDKGGTKEKAQQINETYERLSAWIKHSERRKREARRRRASQSLRAALWLLLLVGSGGYKALRWRADSGQTRPPKQDDLAR
ncbi:MAG: J domain-containing protein [Methylocella sp.]